MTLRVNRVNSRLLIVDRKRKEKMHKGNSKEQTNRIQTQYFLRRQKSKSRDKSLLVKRSYKSLEQTNSLAKENKKEDCTTAI
jgi:DNA primase catalytic subunit